VHLIILHKIHADGKKLRCVLCYFDLGKSHSKTIERDM